MDNSYCKQLKLYQMSKISLKPAKRSFLLFSTLVTVIMLTAPASTQAQGLVFKDASLYSGTDGQNGAVYRFPNVATNVDGYVKISGRSSSAVTLTSIDLENTGWDKAFQPEVACNKNNTSQSERDWWMEFEIS